MPAARSAPPRPHSGYWSHRAALHGAVLLFGVAGLFAKWIAAPAVVIVAGRVLVASAAFAVLFRLRPGAVQPVPTRERMQLLACGAILAYHWVTFFHAIQVSTVAVGLLAYSTAPVFAVLLEVLWLRERFSLQALLCAVVTVAGVALIVPSWHLGDAVMQGVLWGVQAGFSFAVLSLLNRRLVARHSSLRVAFWQDATALVLLAPLVPFLWQPLRALDVALLVVLGVLCTAVAHALFIQAMRAVRAGVAAIASALEPVYGIALAWLLLGEVPALRTLAGGALILGAVLWATLRPEAGDGA